MVTAPILNGDEALYARELRSWRERRGMTKRALADAMAYDPSRISHIESGRQTPTEEFTRQAEEALQTGGALWACWEAIAAGRFGLPARPPERELRTAPLIAWLADHSTATFQSLYSAVSSAVAHLEREPPSIRLGRDHSRRMVTRHQLAAVVASYYGTPGPGGQLYRARVGSTRMLLSILTRPEWLDPGVTLGGESEAVRYVPPTTASGTHLGDDMVAAAVQRLASIETTTTVVVNNPLYRLLDVDLDTGALSATFTAIDFADHVLTTELMEEELISAAASSTNALPLRDAYLPDTQAAFALGDRACIGGTASLLAVARRRGADRDYVLFTQERSPNVINRAGRLAVIPKGFHQPTGEPASEARLSVTLQREFEEELLGRQDLEQVGPNARHHVDLLHAQLVTEPMAWLLDRPGSFRTECTGLGFNLVTGNYEFACLLVIEDDGWWDRYGHLVELNWEAERVHRHSTLDTAGLEALTTDPRWGNESLFSLLQGLRRLNAVGDPDRMAIPTIELEN
jgi:transcriptional regulator with XRE-family HTH domain